MRHYTTYSKPKALVWDNAKWHQTPEVLQACERLGLKIYNTPPRSPDLNPNDSNVFGCAKRAYLDQLHSSSLTWQEKAEELERLLCETDPSAHIQGWVLRLKACVHMKGQDFKQALKDMKKNARVEGNQLIVGGEVLAYIRR